MLFLSQADRVYMARARRHRGMRQEELAEMLGTSRATIANIETGRVTVPRRDLTRALKKVLAEWRTEDRQAEERMPMEVGEARGVYVADIVCPGCGTRVPGPAQGAAHCQGCGQRFEARECGRCGRVVDMMTAAFCPYCGDVLE